MKRFPCLLAIILLMCSCTPIGLPSETDPVSSSTAATTTTTASESLSQTTTTATSATTTTAGTETSAATSATTASETTAPPETTTKPTGTPKVIIQGQSESAAEIIVTAPESVAAPPAETTPAVTFPPESAVTFPTAPAVTFPPETTPGSLPPFAGQNSYNTLNFREQKGFWVSYLEYMSILNGKTQETFTASIDKMFDNIVGIGFNTVYVQVRAFGDAYYDSDYYPAGTQFSGIIGYKPGDVPFDALKIMVKSAHDRGISFHAWVNPMRLCTSAQMKTLSPEVPYKAWYDDSEKRSKRLYEYNNYWYLSPSSPDCNRLIINGITEIIANYDVDGIHIDDYFYPSGDLSFDSDLYAVSGSELSQRNWRKENINRLVKEIYSAVHAANPDTVFGISPQAHIQNNTDISADVRTWCSTAGYCDYILPQVYYGFENATMPYSDTIALWSSMVTAPGVKLVIGLSPYKIGLDDGYAGASGRDEWQKNTDIIARQMVLAKTLPNYGGIALYRYGSLFSPERNVAEMVYSELENIRKLD